MVRSPDPGGAGLTVAADAGILPVAIVGGGPAGLMAAEVISAAGVPVTLFDAMPSVGRKFLMAGRGGLNLTHAEPAVDFMARYGAAQPALQAALHGFGPEALRAWAAGLGIDTFVGSSGRVFPREMKAAPLLRAWLHRLRLQGVRFQVRHRWLGLTAGEGGWQLRFATPDGERTFVTHTVLLALGGGSWAKLGSDGRWVEPLHAAGVALAPLRPANCGFDVAWSEHFSTRHAGEPLKSITATYTDTAGNVHRRKGECVVSATGLEGSLIYALSAGLRDRIERDGSVVLSLDLLPDWNAERVAQEVAWPRGARSLASHLQSRLGITGVKAGLLRECTDKAVMGDSTRLAHALKALPVTLCAARPMDEAISTAGGVVLNALNDDYMLPALPGVFCAGEMLDWEAPTGGYLLTACFATGHAAGLGVLRKLLAAA